MAPNANIVAQKVLNASGSGYSTDVANGLVRAANAGASVINLSLTFGNTPELVSAINYAAGKGAFIVWAGGNSAQNLLGGASTRGLTAAAVVSRVGEVRQNGDGQYAPEEIPRMVGPILANTADVVTESVRLVQSKLLRAEREPTAMRCNMGTRALRERAYESESESGV
jgi:subtilisin family serine protease